MEDKFKRCRQSYEQNYDVHCFKCVTSMDTNVFNDEFNIKEIPAFIFFRDGSEVSRYEDADEPVLNAPTGEKDPTGYQLKLYLDTWCNPKN